MEALVGKMQNILNNIERVIIGKREAAELMLMALICKGHVLIEDVPGVGKTSMAAALAKSVDCSFKRIQFTPDIMPSDVTGFSVYNPKTGGFDYKPGPIMSHFILADEINRTSPKTQSSLLEVMEENQVTVDGVTYKTPTPFMVLATQNPVEYLGTYPLPEAQLDRFFMKITIGYPGKEEESKMLSRFRQANPMEALTPVVSHNDVLELQSSSESIYVHDDIADYIVSLVRLTRSREDLVSLGASPRGSISLYKGAQAWAMYNNRDYVIPEDVQKMAPYILRHRIMLKQEAKLKKITALDIIQQSLDRLSTGI